MIDALTVGQLYSNEEIFKALKVSNAGGIRLSLEGKSVQRAIIMTSVLLAPTYFGRQLEQFGYVVQG